MKHVIFILLSLFFLASSAQETGALNIYGKVKYKKSMMSELKIEVYKDNELQKEMKNLINGSFKLDLKLGSVYSIAFSKDSYIEKSVSVVAKTDSTTSISGRYFFQLDIELFKEEDGEVDETVLPPLAKLYIKDQNTGFVYDKKYVKWAAEEYNEEKE